MLHSRSLVRTLLCASMSLAGAACSSSDSAGVSTPPSQIPDVLHIAITPQLDSALLGTSKELHATVVDQTGATRNTAISWTSSNPAVASLSGSTLTALAPGETKIFARAGNAVDSARIVIYEANFRLQISPSAVAASLGDTVSFEATVVAEDGTKTTTAPVNWEISDTSSAKLVGSGALATLSEGDVQVSASLGGVTAYSSVNIKLAPVASVTLAPTTISTAVGTVTRLVATLRDGKGRVLDRPVTWASLNAAVATVNNQGNVTAVAAGGTVITATAEGRSASATINVSSTPATSVALSLPRDSMAVSNTMQASATPLDANGKPMTGRTLAWQSSNPAVATINSSGSITALVAGQTKISVICDGIVTTRTLTVISPTATTLVLTPNSVDVLVGASSQLSAEVRDQLGNILKPKTLTWSSANTGVVSVSSTGAVTGVSLGSANVTVSTGGLTASGTVNVRNVPVANVSVTPATTGVVAGKSVALTVTSTDASGAVLTNRVATFASSDVNVASVDASGLVTGVAKGTATISVTVEGKVATVVVTVLPGTIAPVATVTFTLNSSVLNPRETTASVAESYDANGNRLDRAFSYASLNPNVATIDSRGVITAIASGTVSLSVTAEGVTAYASLTVATQAPVPVANVIVTTPKSQMQVGDSAQLSVVLKDASGNVLTGRTIAFNSSSSMVAPVTTRGLVHAGSVGNATVSASSEGVSSGVALSVASTPVAPAPVATVSVALNSSSLNVGEATQATATLRDSAGNILTGRTMVWSSSNTATATVSQSGYVTAVGAGSATISVTSEGVVGSAALTSSSAPIVVASVQVTLAKTSISVGQSVQANAVAKDASGNVLTVPISWTVSGSSGVAVIGSSNGATASVNGTSAGSVAIVATSGSVTGSSSLSVVAVPVTSSPVALPAAPTLLNFSYPTVTGKQWIVSAGADLQTALNNAQRGDEVVIQAGATFTGNYVLPAKAGTAANGWILVRSSASAQLPAMGNRVGPANAGLMPKIISPNSDAAIKTALTASGWWLSGLEISIVPTLTTNYGIVYLGDGGSAQNSLSKVASDLVLDRDYIHASPTTPTSRCVALNSMRTAIQDSYLMDCHGKGFDSQAILGWNGPGPYKIVNNMLAGAGENVMFGGADPNIAGLIPSDIEIRRNYVYSPLSWKTTWTKKNLMELKNAQRLIVEGNVFDGSWADAQVGFAITMKSTNQSGGCTWCFVGDVTVRNNIVRNSGSAFGLSAKDPGVVGGLTNRILIEQNIVENINVGGYAGDGRFVSLQNDLQNVTIRGNSMSSTGVVKQFLILDTTPAATGLVYENNVAAIGAYGLFNTTYGIGEVALKAVNGTVSFKNVVLIGPSTSGYPNARFVSDLTTATATGVGANMSAVQSATSGVAVP